MTHYSIILDKSKGPPSIEVTIGGIIVSVPQLDIKFTLPGSEIFEKDGTQNVFNIFRKLCHIALKSKHQTVQSSEVSKEVAHCWNSASESFKDFFYRYSETIKVHKPKGHKFRTPYKFGQHKPRRTRGPNKKTKDKNSGKLFISQENVTGEVFQNDLVHFTPVGSVPCETLTTSAYNCWMDDVRRAEEINFNRFENFNDYVRN